MTSKQVSENLDDFTVVAAIDMDDVDADTTFTVIAGKAADGAVYASRSNIYLVLAEWTYYQSASYTRSVFLKLRLNGPDVVFDTMMWAPGQLLNQYAMSEADGSFRVATTSRAVSGWWFDTSNNLYVFDETGNEVGAVEGLAPGETIKAVRFTTDRCYLVTFVQTDPLFVISLEEAVPKVLGELKIPGFSSYLHMVNATHMIGVGRDADPATGTERGLQFSLFDVSDELNPRQAAVVIVADRGSDSEALDDAKAFQFWSASDLRAAGVASPGIFAVPAQLASLALAKERGATDTSTWATGANYFQGLLMLDVALTPLGNVTHLSQGFWDEDEDDNDNYWWAYAQRSSTSSGGHITRSLRRGDAVYTFSDNFVGKNSLDDGRSLGVASLAVNATYSDYDDDYGYWYYVW